MTPATVGLAETENGSATGAIGQCPGYPVPPFATWTVNGVTYTVANICHLYSGTVSGIVSGVQYTAIFPDGSRKGFGDETLTGSVAGHQGTAELSFTFTRPCFPSCPGQIHIWSEGGAGGLEDLELDLLAVGVGPFTYSGTYSL
jgi:hypothetical protein